MLLVIARMAVEFKNIHRSSCAAKFAQRTSLKAIDVHVRIADELQIHDMRLRFCARANYRRLLPDGKDVFRRMGLSMLLTKFAGCSVVLTMYDWRFPSMAKTWRENSTVGALGFDEVPKPEELAKRGGAWFRSGDVTLHLGVDRHFAPAKKAHPALRCIDYETLIERLRRNGLAVTPAPPPFEGRPHCYIADPFGNRLELIG